MTDVTGEPFHAALLAALPVEGGYFSVFKIVLFLLCGLLFAQNAAWADKDTAKIKVRRGPWNLAIFGTGTLCLFVWPLIPLYWVGFAVFALLYGTAIISYVVFRNGRVAPAQTVLSRAHLKRLTAAKAETTDTIHSKDRVRLKGADGKTPPWPTDPHERAGYQGVQDLLFDAIWRRASDVRMDMAPQQDVRVSYKVDGVERLREPIEAQLGAVIYAQLKSVAGMDPAENRRPQSGHFRAAIGAGSKAEKTVDVDIKTSGSTAGQRIVLKLFAEEQKFRLADVGLTKEQLGVFEPLLQKPGGVVVIGGPKAAGVTSTLYALLRFHDAFMQNIHTLELTKALDLENITQHVFDAKDSTVTFGRRFQSMLRTDPDVAMAGDTVDADTAQLAAGAGRQGKRVYLGMAAKDTFSALRKFIQFVDDNPLAASGLAAVTCQRLVRVLCPNCRRGYKPDPNLLKKANLPTGENRPFYRPPNPEELEVDKQGNPIICQVCQGSGYLGRTGVFELLIVDDPLKALIAKGAALPVIKAQARKAGMLYMQEIALHKVYDGLTSINEVLRVTREDTPAVARA